MVVSPAARSVLAVLGLDLGGAALIGRVLERAGATPVASAWSGAALERRRSRWSDPFGPRRGAAAVEDGEALAAARAALATPVAGGAPLLVQDAAGSLVAEVWKAAFAAEGLRPVYVIPVLAPAEAAASLKAEHGFTRNRGLLLWATYLLRAEQATRGERRVFVSLARLHEDPERELDRVERALGARLPRRDWDAAAAVEDLLHAERQSAPRAAPAAPPAALAPIVTLYDHLEAAAADAPGNADVTQEVERWFETLEAAVAPVVKEFERGAGEPPPVGVAAPGSLGDPSPGNERADRAEAAAQARPDAQDAALAAARRDTEEAQDRAHAAESQAVVLQRALAVARRQAAEAEELLQGRLVAAQAGERDAREALSAAILARESAEARADAAESDHERLATESTEERRRLAAAVEQERALNATRFAEVRERLETAGVTLLATQARARDLQAQLAEAKGELHRRNWLRRLLGLG